jgi:phosphonate transport system substrate-binding protein
LDPAVAERLRQALLALDYQDPEQKKILEAAGIIGVREASEADFEPVRRLEKMVEASRISPKTLWPAPSRDIKTWSD